MERPVAIFGIGKNYAEHAKEIQGEVPERPIVFMKNPASVIADGEAIVIPRACTETGEQVDYEGELAVFIGRRAKDVEEQEALRFVAGYAPANDVSARWWQMQGAGGQWVRGKSFDTFCPVGKMAPANDVPDPQALRITTRINGELMQNGSTADMIFPVSRLIAELSRGTTLLPGTVILTGTPAGVGIGRNPPRLLRDGDVVTVEIPGVGRLRNPVTVA